MLSSAPALLSYTPFQCAGISRRLFRRRAFTQYYPLRCHEFWQGASQLLQRIFRSMVMYLHAG